ncbi:Uncharacterised protein [Capnocytophaga canimorsus]|nr:hypothetical protein CLV61_1784 [Capnocytophaga canimorsus]STA71758.1 Uncharacterised protein [Capnocytophaga canimorsus]
MIKINKGNIAVAFVISTIKINYKMKTLCYSFITD